MSTRVLFLGMTAILIAGGAAWFIIRPGSTALGPGGQNDPVAPPAATYEPLPPDSIPYGSDAARETGEEVHAILDLGEEAPNFELERLAGGSFELADHRGELVVLNFWATWCEPCREEMPDLVMLQDSLAGDGVRVVGVSLDEEGREVVASFHDTFPVDYPLLLDGLDVAREYGAHHVVPTTYVVDRMGRVADRFEGAMTIEELLPQVRSHLEPPFPALPRAPSTSNE